MVKADHLLLGILNEIFAAKIFSHIKKLGAEINRQNLYLC